MALQVLPLIFTGTTRFPAIVTTGVCKASDPIKVRVIVSPCFAYPALAFDVVIPVKVSVGGVKSKSIVEFVETGVPELVAKSE